MSDLQVLYTQAKKLVLTLRAGLERLETAEQVGVECAAPQVPATPANPWVRP